MVEAEEEGEGERTKRQLVTGRRPYIVRERAGGGRPHRSQAASRPVWPGYSGEFLRPAPVSSGPLHSIVPRCQSLREFPVGRAGGLAGDTSRLENIISTEAHIGDSEGTQSAVFLWGELRVCRI